ncbi:hypothetical protein [Methylobacterium sp. J-076]|uniref:hypothetical protein n=1 Tax=Methylobacterium sp. J-076 TaxID=2836655 RepID=UPI001FB99019|nr:hypothetical protein [Methylobacterium sp. J-076]MCJ2015536.1 hypothetical protein [Methylobacterium sp. J-076]
MRLHYTRVRRARGLAMPVPPTPRKRPLRSPVLFGFMGIPVRTRADVLRGWGTWDAFLDDVFRIWVPDPMGMPHMRHHIEQLFPPAEMDAHREDMYRRWEEGRKHTGRLAANLGRLSIADRIFGKVS